MFRRLLGAPAAGAREAADAGLLEHASQLLLAGDNRGAIQAYRDYLKTDPYNVVALNDMGACLADVGDEEQAVAAFELAYSLDDTFIPAMVNRAKLLNDRHRSDEALELLRRAKVGDPTFTHTHAVYAGVLLKRGLTTEARQWQLKAWLAHFDNVRAANSHLFWMGYDDVPEEQLAAEHRFWAETLRPIDHDPPARIRAAWRPGAPRRIRIGYWSPDFRSHAVRFFFRPLLEHQDTSRFEVFLYHDYPGGDAQTKLIEAAAEHFHRVHDLTDDDLRQLIASHELDVLVDLAGHTSHNRIPLLQCRLARLQVNALGYPPTTGLRSVDAKLIDRHVLTADAALYYTERPMALPSSFWCFDPLEEVPLPGEPPVLANGHVTFGSVGNVAKITPAVAQAWRQILARVPGSRLQIRSITFLDEGAERLTRERLASYGLPGDRIDFQRPLGGKEFFASYDGIDIVLDTFPFNGGTTSCFAAYMGVPIVTVTGRSLIGRMGLSVLTNVGIGHLSAADVPSYVECAVQLAADVGFLRTFKREARGRFRAGALGDGKLFAAEFEQACEALLAEQAEGRAAYKMEVPTLPAAEIMRRAYDVLRAGQVEAGQRILAHCLEHYPRTGAAHLLKAQLMVWGGRVDLAIAATERALSELSQADRDAALAALARMHLLQEDRQGAARALERLAQAEPADPFDAMQVALYRACIGGDTVEAPTALPPAGRILMLVPCDDAFRFDVQRAQLERDCVCPPGWQLDVQRCPEQGRLQAYRDALGGDCDVVVLVQKNVQVCHAFFIANVLEALESADIVGCTGARRWSRLDWRTDDFAQKAGGFIGRSSERGEGYELHILGPGARVQDGMAVLNGSLLAIRTRGRPAPAFDEDLLGAETLLEEAWTQAAAQAGWRLAAHGDLGLFIDADVALDSSNRTEARMHFNDQRGFDPFASVRDDHVSVSAPAASLAEAAAIGQRYFGNRSRP